MSTDKTTSSGVQQLIDRLHEEGVEKGRTEADAVLAAARQQAMDLLDQARRQADEILTVARQEAERTRASGEEAVRLAGRDAILRLTEELREDFERKLRRLIGHALTDTDFLKQLLLQVARHAVPADSQGTVKVSVLTESVAGTESSRAGELFRDEDLDQFAHSLAGEALREGLTFELAEGEAPGVRVQFVDDDLEVDLTADTLTHLLLKNLSPRFRAIIQRP